ncbi:hypothetical protein CDD83_7129 [Cordyceps sp. RAO-2017]|nr:hypothetical protein CDD83_7129 [Cordyceps sp. RAO-2017]
MAGAARWPARSPSPKSGREEEEEEEVVVVAGHHRSPFAPFLVSPSLLPRQVPLHRKCVSKASATVGAPPRPAAAAAAVTRRGPAAWNDPAGPSATPESVSSVRDDALLLPPPPRASSRLCRAPPSDARRLSSCREQGLGVVITRSSHASSLPPTPARRRTKTAAATAPPYLKYIVAARIPPTRSILLPLDFLQPPFGSTHRSSAADRMPHYLGPRLIVSAP